MSDDKLKLWNRPRQAARSDDPPPAAPPPAPKPKGLPPSQRARKKAKAVTVYVDDETYRSLGLIALDRGIKLQPLMLEAIDAFLAAHHQPRTATTGFANLVAREKAEEGDQ